MSRSFSISLALALGSALVLGACQTTGQNYAAAHSYDKVVVSGTPIKLGHFSSLNEDCSSIGDTTVRITQQPQHGQVTLRHENGYAFYASENPRHVCNSRPTPGIALVYVSDPGYVGPDSVAVDAIYANGFERTVSFSLNVK